MQSSNVGRAPGDEYCALAEFRYLIRDFLAASERIARAHGLSPQQHQLLLAVRGCPPGTEPTIGYLARRLLIRHHSVVGLVNRLARRGLVVRTPEGEDRRRVAVRLTAQGAAILRDLSAEHRREIRLRAPRLVEALGAVIALGTGDPLEGAVSPAPGEDGVRGRARDPCTG
ncbi:MAG: winged helix-turn-helix transcriptional regulator [Chloroflexi bacterium]|nr:winged helix-turn-helix transcriptional regulator [Chloroflexota bacterium]